MAKLFDFIAYSTIIYVCRKSLNHDCGDRRSISFLLLHFILYLIWSLVLSRKLKDKGSLEPYRTLFMATNLLLDMDSKKINNAFTHILC